MLRRRSRPVVVSGAFAMKRSLAVLMDPIAAIHPEKDSTLAMLLEAQRRGYEAALRAAERPRDPRRRALGAAGAARGPRRRRGLVHARRAGLARSLDVDVILARKDPPFDDQFLYDTMVLELAEMRGVLVVNRPQGLRDANEKLFSLHFPQCTPPTLIARDAARNPPFRRRARRSRAQAAGRHGRSLDLPQPQRRSEPQRHHRDADRQRPQVLRRAALHSGDHAPATSAS